MTNVGFKAIQRLVRTLSLTPTMMAVTVAIVLSSAPQGGQAESTRSTSETLVLQGRVASHVEVYFPEFNGTTPDSDVIQTKSPSRSAHRLLVSPIEPASPRAPSSVGLTIEAVSRCDEVSESASIRIKDLAPSPTRAYQVTIRSP
jgi:hypothetical protein